MAPPSNLRRTGGLRPAVVAVVVVVVVVVLLLLLLLPMLGGGGGLAGGCSCVVKRNVRRGCRRRSAVTNFELIAQTCDALGQL